MKRYNSMNGLRTIACMGIILMHVKANIDYSLQNDIVNTVINSFTQFVFLFMIISSFSMCCGYYEKVKNNEITVEQFYKRRFSKVIPFFLTLIILDVIIEHNVSAMIEGFTDATLMFGFLQKDIEVLGVAWFLGLVFIFYMIFPFFVFLFSNKRRAWFVTIIAFLMNIVSIGYFHVGRTNMFYSFVYFTIGGILYLYKDKIAEMVQKHKFISIILCVIGTVLYFIIPSNEYFMTIEFVVIFSLWLCLAIGIPENTVLDNKVTKFISNISMEMYLSHMVCFRVIEKLHLTKIFQNDYLSYCMTSCLVIVGTILGAMFFNQLLKKIKDKTNYKFEEVKVNHENFIG